MFFLIPTLLLRKIKGERGLHATVKARLRLWKNKQWPTLINNLQRDILIVHSPTVDNSRKNAASTKAFNVKWCDELVAAGYMSRGSKALLSKGASDANKEGLAGKFPKRKKEIAEPTEVQWELDRASLDKEILRACVLKLK